MKKKILLLATLTLLLTGCGQNPKLKNGEEVLVELSDGTKYSVDEIWKEFKEDYAIDIILKKIDTKLLEEEFKDSKSDIDEYVKSMETNMRANYETEEQLLNALQYYGYSSLEDYLDMVRANRLRTLLTNEFAKSQVTDKEIEKYYKEEIVGDIEAVHILVTPSGTDKESDTKAKEKATEIINAIKKDIKSGTSAIDAFNKYKDDDDVKFEDLGRFTKGDNVTEFDDAAFALKTNQYTTSPIKTSYGYHVILKTKEYEKEKLDDMKDKIKTTLAEEKIENDSTMQAQALNDLRKKNNIKINDKDLERAYNKYMNYQLNQDK